MCNSFFYFPVQLLFPIYTPLVSKAMLDFRWDPVLWLVTQAILPTFLATTPDSATNGRL